MILPLIHSLHILVEDQDLERSLRRQCETYIAKQMGGPGHINNIMETLQKRILPQLKLIDIDRIKPNNVASYHPKMLMQMCLGYLKLGSLDVEVREFLIQKKHLTVVVEEWIQGESPIENEASRVLVKFLSKLVIPNQVLSEWLTTKYQIYQKTNDLLLSYIAENWHNERLQVGEYLISKAGADRQLLGVFIPILEMVSQKTPNYSGVLLKCIPREWTQPH